MKSCGADRFSGYERQPEIPVSPPQVRSQLAKICAAEEFRRSKRSTRFLTYIVEETLAGRASRIKAYSVAISVLDRDDTFDPQTDPMVRIEASQLRRRLERYYLTEGIDDPVVIDLPKGGYVPVFRAARVLASVDPPPAANPASETWRIPAVMLGTAFLTIGVAAFAWSRQSVPQQYSLVGGLKTGPRIQVVPFAAATADDRSHVIAAGLADEVTQALTRSGAVGVVAPPAKGSGASRAQADLLLTGSVRSNGGVVRLTASLVDARMGTYVWTEAYDMPADSPVLALQTAFASGLEGRLPKLPIGSTGVPISLPVEAKVEEGNLQ